MAEAEKKKMTSKKKRLLIAAAAAAVLLLVCRLVLSQMNFFSDLAKEKAVSLARSEMGVDLALSSIEGNPVTGFNASDVVISRSGDAVVSAKNVGINISLPSVLTGSPSLSTLEVDGASGDLQKMIDTLPKTKKSDEPTDIPIDTVVVKNSTIMTQWGDLYVEDAAVDIINSQSYEFEFAGAAAGHKLSASGAAAKKEGVWCADNLKLDLEGGTAEVSGALFPSADVTLSCDKLNLSFVSDIVPELAKYGVRGILSANATLKSVGKGYESEGSGNL
ncbi:MAG: hypothetical protein HUJ86_04985, partial [Synergistes sp.]|nr:hypothetical protein [Synergistes sp.]